MAPDLNIIEEIPPAQAYAILHRYAAQPGTVILDSSCSQHNDACFDIIAFAPCELYWHDGGDSPWRDASSHNADPIDRLSQIKKKPTASDLPFSGGYIGYIGYDSHTQSAPRHHRPGYPCSFIGRYRWAILIDNLNNQGYVVGDSEGKKQWRSFQDNDASLIHQELAFILDKPLTSSTKIEQYTVTINSALDYIYAGDCYQVNLAQRFCGSYKGSTWPAYQHLRERLAAPFSSFFNTGISELLSFSPERFIRHKKGQVRTSPIKGTRPRSRDAALDQALASELSNSEKDNAENLMIVDLLRNDLGRSCVPGSITVEQLSQLQSFANVHHLVSNIRGTLGADVTPFQAFMSAFPGGSITGAPKLRAMEIISELENQPRGAYCGSAFYLSQDGCFDSNILIRTVEAKAGEISCWAGGGIVADSDPQSEFNESVTKVAAIVDGINELQR